MEFPNKRDKKASEKEAIKVGLSEGKLLTINRSFSKRNKEFTQVSRDVISALSRLYVVVELDQVQSPNASFDDPSL